MNGPSSPAASSASRAPGPRSRTCGSQSQMCSEGSRKRSAKAFVATTSSATTPSASIAAVWPASSSSAVAGRRGASRLRETSQPGSGERASSRIRPSTGQLPAASVSGLSGRAAPVGPDADERRGTGTSRRPRARSRAGCGRRAGPARPGSSGAGSARTGRPWRRRTAAASPPARTRSPSRGRAGCRGRRSCASRARARGPRRASRASACVARPMSVSCLRCSRSGVSPNDAGGRSPLVVIVTAGIPRPTSGRLLVEAEGEAEVGQLPERARPARRGAASAR